MPWQLRYIGQPEYGEFNLDYPNPLFKKIHLLTVQWYVVITTLFLPGDKMRPTIIRSSIDIGCSATVVEFLTELGCRMEFEYIARGYMFRKGRMKITVSKVFKVGLFCFCILMK